MNDLNRIRLSLHRALLFNVLSSVRFIFIKVISDKLILTVFSDTDLSLAEKDIYYSVIGEITGDFKELDDSISEVKFIVSQVQYEELSNKNIGDLVYARYE
ncbi:hypothetical protein [Sphingobacterium kyonggiense]